MWCVWSHCRHMPKREAEKLVNEIWQFKAEQEAASGIVMHLSDATAAFLERRFFSISRLVTEASTSWQHPLAISIVCPQLTCCNMLASYSSYRRQSRPCFAVLHQLQNVAIIISSPEEQMSSAVLQQWKLLGLLLAGLSSVHRWPTTLSTAWGSTAMMQTATCSCEFSLVTWKKLCVMSSRP